MIEYKTCVCCGERKSLGEFYPRTGGRSAPTARRADCNVCVRSRATENYRKNREKIKAAQNAKHNQRMRDDPEYREQRLRQRLKYKEQNQKTIAAKSARHYQDNKEGTKARVLAWAQKNRGKSNAIKKAYKLAKTKACPLWVRNNSELRSAMDEIYKAAAEKTAVTGVIHHVDHIIPLRGKTVSGLHVPWNLQVLAGSENCSKSNKFTEN